MSTRTHDKADQNASCPYCKTSTVDAAQLARAEKEFQNELSRKIRDEVHKKEREYRELVRKLKDLQRKEIQELGKRGKDSERLLKEKLVATTRKERNAHKSELAKLRKSHQEQMQRLREVYDRENLRLQKEQESSFNGQLKEIIQNYGNLASAHQKELERLKKAHDESEALSRKKDSEISRLRIELAQSTSKLEVKELMIQLQERNATIEKLNSKIVELELENKLGDQQRQQPAPKAPAKTMTDEEQREKLKEYMRAIIEITRNQRAEKKRSDAASETVEKSGDLAEKSDKMLGWFF